MRVPKESSLVYLPTSRLTRKCKVDALSAYGFVSAVEWSALMNSR